MPRYIVLGNFAAKGIEDVVHAPNRDEAAMRMIEEAGGRQRSTIPSESMILWPLLRCQMTMKCSSSCCRRVR